MLAFWWEVALERYDRFFVDILREVALKLPHCRQNEKWKKRRRKRGSNRYLL